MSDDTDGRTVFEFFGLDWSVLRRDLLDGRDSTSIEVDDADVRAEFAAVRPHVAALVRGASISWDVGTVSWVCWVCGEFVLSGRGPHPDVALANFVASAIAVVRRRLAPAAPRVSYEPYDTCPTCGMTHS